MTLIRIPIAHVLLSLVYLQRIAVSRTELRSTKASHNADPQQVSFAHVTGSFKTNCWSLYRLRALGAKPLVTLPVPFGDKLLPLVDVFRFTSCRNGGGNAAAVNAVNTADGLVGIHALRDLMPPRIFKQLAIGLEVPVNFATEPDEGTILTRNAVLEARLHLCQRAFRACKALAQPQDSNCVFTPSGTMLTPFSTTLAGLPRQGRPSARHPFRNGIMARPPEVHSRLTATTLFPSH